jgi:glycosyltransferase involved in cell wall biosynthesis
VHVLLVEPWYGGSHRAWADGLVAHSAHDVRLLTHVDRFWRWRTHGAAVTLAAEVEVHVAAHGRPDVLLVSTMVDLATLLGLTRHVLADVPVVHDVHESQLLVPAAEGRTPDRDAALVGWRNLVAADVAVFHTAHHRDALLEALPSFLRSFPDRQHVDLVPEVAGKSAVVAMGLDADALAAAGRGADDGPPIVLWNHRWEHDKDPAAFVAAVLAVDELGVPLRVALAGERPVEDPPWLADLERRLGARLLHRGGLDRGEYEALLRRSDVVVSTARHELFGVAVCEAAAAGAAPVLPDRLSYPEVLPSSARYEDHGGLVDALARLLEDPHERARVAAACQAEAARFDWSAVAPQHDALLERVVGG